MGMSVSTGLGISMSMSMSWVWATASIIFCDEPLDMVSAVTCAGGKGMLVH